MGVLNWLLGKRPREAVDDSVPFGTLGLSREVGEPARVPARLKEVPHWPPEDMHDVEAWDRFWNDQVADGPMPQISDMHCDHSGLITYMKNRGRGSILCVGNGMSQEPRALAAAGFAVTALDLSPLAAQLAQAIEPGPDYLGLFLDVASHRSGGSVDYVTADLLDAAACPGPFDVIIERCTVQLFRGQEFGEAMEALTRRLRSDGLFFSHCHDGRGRPRRPLVLPVHAAEGWFREHGWTIWRGDLDAAPPERLASLYISTG